MWSSDVFHVSLSVFGLSHFCSLVLSIENLKVVVYN